MTADGQPGRVFAGPVGCGEEQMTEIGRIDPATFDDLIAGLHVEMPKPPTAAEIWETIHRFISHEPTHTLLVNEDQVEEQQQRVAAAWLGMDVEIIGSPAIPEGTAYLINHAALGIDLSAYRRRGWRIDALERPAPVAPDA